TAQAAGGQQQGWNTLASLAQRAGQDSVGVTQQAGQQIQGLMGQEAAARGAGASNIAGVVMNGLNSLAGAAGGAGGGGGLAGLMKMFTQGGGGGAYGGYGGAVQSGTGGFY